LADWWREPGPTDEQSVICASVGNAPDQTLKRGLVSDHVAGFDLSHEARSIECKSTLPSKYVDPAIGARRGNSRLISLNAKDCSYEFGEGMAGEMPCDVALDLVPGKLREVDRCLIGFMDSPATLSTRVVLGAWFGPGSRPVAAITSKRRTASLRLISHIVCEAPRLYSKSCLMASLGMSDLSHSTFRAGAWMC
jgi:hypothetical protein